jgi:hypothetical protein
MKFLQSVQKLKLNLNFLSMERYVSVSQVIAWQAVFLVDQAETGVNALRFAEENLQQIILPDIFSLPVIFVPLTILIFFQKLK